MIDDPHVPHHDISSAPYSPFMPSSNLIDDTNPPIAIRKGVCSCVKYPISNYVSCSALSPSFRLFSIALSSSPTSHSVSEA